MISRMPFLDPKFVEYGIALDDNVKVRNGYTKAILRDSMKGIMPDNVRLRVDKKGFTIPQEEWFRTEKFQKLVMDILTSESFKSRGYIIPEEAIKLYKKHLSGEVNVSKDIWKWVNLELWFRYFIDKK
jgi:asparagine synthase (glutamine-hydrolysing)